MKSPAAEPQSPQDGLISDMVSVRVTEADSGISYAQGRGDTRMFVQPPDLAGPRQDLPTPRPPSCMVSTLVCSCCFASMCKSVSAFNGFAEEGPLMEAGGMRQLEEG